MVKVLQQKIRGKSLPFQKHLTHPLYTVAASEAKKHPRAETMNQLPAAAMETAVRLPRPRVKRWAPSSPVRLFGCRPSFATPQRWQPQHIDSVWFTPPPHFFLRAFPWRVRRRFSSPQTVAQLPWRWQALAGNQAASMFDKFAPANFA